MTIKQRLRKLLGYDYCVVDLPDNFILFTGTIHECEQVIDESYGGLMIVHESDLPVGLS